MLTIKDQFSKAVFWLLASAKRIPLTPRTNSSIFVLKVRLVSKVSPSVASQRASFLTLVEGAEPSPVTAPLLSIVEMRVLRFPEVVNTPVWTALPVLKRLAITVSPVDARLAAVATPVLSMVERRVFRLPETL